MSAVNEIEQLMGEWYALCQELEPLEETMAPIKRQKDTCEAKIKELTRLLGKGHSAPHLGVEVVFRKGYKKVTWDSAALAGFAAAHPEILPFRSEKETQPSITIRMTDKLPF